MLLCGWWLTGFASLAFAWEPVRFVAQQGQFVLPKGEDIAVRYMAQAAGVRLYLTDRGLLYVWDRMHEGAHQTYRAEVRWQGANRHARVIAEGPSDDYLNFYGGTPDGVAGVRSYARVTYQQIYPHIDLVVYGHEQGIKYDFVLHPGANPQDIVLGYTDLDKPTKERDGSLSVRSPFGTVREGKPVLRQGDQTWTGDWQLAGNQVRFLVGGYDRSRTLVIDPPLVWGSYYGGNALDEVRSVQVAADGSYYIAGVTQSATVIPQAGFQNNPGGGRDAFIAKFSAGGTRLWATYYGGTGEDFGTALAIDAQQQLYLAGSTGSVSGMSTPDSHQPSFGGGSTDLFVAKFQPDGIRLWASYLGGSGNESDADIATDSDLRLLVCGTTNSPGTGGGALDVLVSAFQANGNRLWISYLGGTANDIAGGIAVDPQNHILLVGRTESSTGIATGTAAQSVYGGNTDGFLARYTPAGVPLWRGYLGGSGYDLLEGVATDATGRIYVTGFTASASMALNTQATDTLTGGFDAWLSRFEPSGQRGWTTYIGGKQADYGQALAVDATGNAWVAGFTESSDKLGTGGHQYHRAGETDGFIARVMPDGRTRWTSYYGGAGRDLIYDIRVDSDRKLFFGGSTESDSRIAQNGFQPNYGGNTDGFVGIFERFEPLPAPQLQGFGMRGRNRLFWPRVAVGTVRNYRLYRSQNPDFQPSESTLIATLDSSTFVYIDSPTVNQQLYHYYLAATSTDGVAGIRSGRLDIRTGNQAPYAFQPFPSPVYVNEDAPPFTIRPVRPTIRDWENDPFTILGYSSDTTIVQVSYDAAGDSLRFRLKQDAFGSVWAGASASDGESFGGNTFFLVVQPVNDPPVIAGIPDQQVCRNQVTNLNLPAYTRDVDDTVTSRRFVYTAQIIASTNALPFDLLNIQIDPVTHLARLSSSATQLGAFTVVFRATDPAGLSDTDTILVNLAATPSASIQPPTGAICQFDQVNFGQTSALENGSITGYAWDFGANGSIEATTATAVHAFADTGQVAVRLTVTGSNGCTWAVTTTVQVRPGPQPLFTTANTCTGQTTVFTATSTSAPSNPITQHQWDLDNDGTFEVTGTTASRNFGVAGTYPIRYRVTSQNGCVSTIRRDIVIGEFPVADFTVPGGQLCARVPILFTSTSTVAGNSSLVRWQWDFDNDGSVDVDTTAPAVLYALPVGGNQQVRLRVLTDRGCAAVMTKTLNLLPSPQIQFDVVERCAGQPTNFVDRTTFSGGTITSRAWDFTSDGVYDATGTTAQVTYPSAGSYLVTLRLTTSLGCTLTLSRRVVSGSLPRAEFVANPACVGSPTTFTNASTVIFGQIAGAEWDFDGNGVYEASGNQVTHTFNTTGNFAVRMRTFTAQGCERVVSTQINVVTGGTPNFGFPGQICTNNPVNFTDQSVTAVSTIARREWDYDGNGTTDAVTNQPVHTYTAAGTYQVRLTIVLANGCRHTVSRPVTVLQGPNPAISQNGFTLQSTPASAYQWFVNDQPIIGSFGQNHIATIPGIYYVVATSPNGCQNRSNSIDLRTVGVENDMLSQAISLYPNPVQELLRLHLRHAETGTVELLLYDALGRLLQQRQVEKTQEEWQTEWRTDDWPSGIYTIEIRLGKARVMRKVVK